MNIQGFDLGLPDTTYEWLMSIVVILFACALIILCALFVKYAGKGTIIFIKETLSDPSGHGDIKYVLAALITLMALIPCILVGVITGKWIPEYALWPLVITITGLAGASSIDFKSAMVSGKAILKPEPPKDKIVDTNQEVIEPTPQKAKIPLVKKQPVAEINPEGDGSI